MVVESRADGAGEIEAQGFVGVKRTSDADQRLREVGVDAPVVRLVGSARVERETLPRNPTW